MATATSGPEVSEGVLQNGGDVLDRSRRNRAADDDRVECRGRVRL